jgi:molybdate transport system regulatory protein
MSTRGDEAYPRLRLLLGPATRMGPGKAALLEVIARTGSISGAAREMRMSYKRAWDLVEELNATFRGAVVETSAGGAGGGGARLTPLGEEILRRYRALERKTQRAAAPELRALAALVRR